MTERQTLGFPDRKRIPSRLWLALIVTGAAIATILAMFIVANLADAWWMIPGPLQGAGVLLLLPLGLLECGLLMVSAKTIGSQRLWWVSLLVLVAVAGVAVLFAYLALLLMLMPV